MKKFALLGCSALLASAALCANAANDPPVNHIQFHNDTNQAYEGSFAPPDGFGGEVLVPGHGTSPQQPIITMTPGGQTGVSWEVDGKQINCGFVSNEWKGLLYNFTLKYDTNQKAYVCSYDLQK
jgi:hypothetical protein